MAWSLVGDGDTVLEFWILRRCIDDVLVEVRLHSYSWEKGVKFSKADTWHGSGAFELKLSQAIALVRSIGSYGATSMLKIPSTEYLRLGRSEYAA